MQIVYNETVSTYTYRIETTVNVTKKVKKKKIVEKKQKVEIVSEDWVMENFQKRFIWVSVQRSCT